MKALKLGQRVRVLRCGREGEDELPDGATGVCVRKIFRDDSWWVALDKRYDGVSFPFSEDDQNRATNVIVWPQDCSPLERP